jgi:hypothetical protein
MTITVDIKNPPLIFQEEKILPCEAKVKPDNLFVKKTGQLYLSTTVDNNPLSGLARKCCSPQQLKD